MKVIIASVNKDKIAAVESVLRQIYREYSLTPVQTSSNVNEQPIGQETVVGVDQRTLQILQSYSEYDCVIAIENGLFIENGEFVDRAVVAVTFKDKPTIIEHSIDGVIFPMKYVEMTSNAIGGFVHNTVGEIMQKEGYVKDNSDPHIDLCGKHRKDFIVETLLTVFFTTS